MQNYCDLVSILIPVYNSEKFLKRCLDSAIHQTYTNIEIIIVDDGSTDRSGRICDDYLNISDKVKVYHNENHGIAYSRNFAIEKSRGNYIFWIDSDDYISENTIETLYKIAKEEDSDFVISNFKKGTEEDYKFNNNINGIQHFTSLDALNCIYESDYKSFLMVCCWGKLIKREVYSGIKYPDGYIFEDVATSHYLLNNSKNIIFVDTVLYYYFQRKDSILSRKLSLKKLDYLYFFEDRIKYFKTIENIELEKKARLQFLHSLIWEYSRVKDILKNGEKLKEIKNKYRSYYKYGDCNLNNKYESRYYMLLFYLSPWFFDFSQKVIGRLKNG